MYADFLRVSGVDVRTAADGQGGVETAIAWPPDVIVMDWSMPRVTGDEATRLLKADARTRHVPIAILTAFGDLAKSRAEAAGANAVCAKPCDPSQLLALVNRLAAHTRGPNPPTKRRGRRRVQKPGRVARTHGSASSLRAARLLDHAATLKRDVRATLAARRSRRRPARTAAGVPTSSAKRGAVLEPPPRSAHAAPDVLGYDRPCSMSPSTRSGIPGRSSRPRG
jgi:CheY-like chemotaxis protein